MMPWHEPIVLGVCESLPMQVKPPHLPFHMRSQSQEVACPTTVKGVGLGFGFVAFGVLGTSQPRILLKLHLLCPVRIHRDSSKAVRDAESQTEETLRELEVHLPISVVLYS